MSGMSSSTCAITPWAYSFGVTPDRSDLFAATTSARPSDATFEEPHCLGWGGGCRWEIGRGWGVCIWLAFFAGGLSTMRTRTEKAEEKRKGVFADKTCIA